MKVEIQDGRLIVTPITVEEERIIFAMAAAYAAFESVRFPVTEQVSRCSRDGNTQSDSPHLHPSQEE